MGPFEHYCLRAYYTKSAAELKVISIFWAEATSFNMDLRVTC